MMSKPSNAAYRPVIGNNMNSDSVSAFLRGGTRIELPQGYVSLLQADKLRCAVIRSLAT
jgi:hypothetical protein